MKNAHKSAFAAVESSGNYLSEGLSKRELIAAMALQALLSSPENYTRAEAVQHATTAADDLLARLEEKGSQ